MMLAFPLLTFLVIGFVNSFSGQWPFTSLRRTTVKGVGFSLGSFSSGVSGGGDEQAGNKKKPLTAADILSRARKAAGVVSDEEDEINSSPVILFDEPLLGDIQNTLLTLEKRIKNGPGSLSVEEIKMFEAASNRILVDMKNYKEPPKKVKSTSFMRTMNNAAPTSPISSPTLENDPDDIFSPFAVLSQSELKKSQQLSVLKQSPYEQPLQGEAHAVVDSLMNQPSDADDENESEGPKFNGRSGYGMPSGTRNTYWIPGMDEMSAEEYRDALQKSVSDRQALRKQRGITGNRSSQSYLDQLGSRE